MTLCFNASKDLQQHVWKGPCTHPSHTGALRTFCFPVTTQPPESRSPGAIGGVSATRVEEPRGEVDEVVEQTNGAGKFVPAWCSI